jgi:anti-sigma B factor antagonist
MLSPTRTQIEQSGELAVMRFEGDIMSASEEAVMGKYRSLESGTKKILLDFSRVPYLNSSGIAVVIQLLKASRMAAQQVACFGLSPHFVKVFRILGLAQYTSLYADEAAARAAVAQ